MFIRSLSLQDMCLNVVINNLELIVSNRRIPQKSTDFLLRLYAAEVFHEYKKIKEDNEEDNEEDKEEGKIEEDIMLWFLNPYAKEITLPRELYTERIIDRLQIVGTAISTLNLSESAAPESELNAIIRSVPCIETLNLSLTSCTDKTLAVIHEVCPYLENLDVSHCPNVTDVGIENLCGQNLSLKVLDLTGSGVTCAGICIILKRMPSLECYKFGCDTSNLLDMDGMPQKYNLTEFIYRGPLHTKQNPLKFFQMLINRCPKIKKLYITDPVEEEVLRICTGFQDLEVIKLRMFVPFLHVSTLILSFTEIPTLMLVENLKNLKKLYLENVSFTCFKEEDITHIENKLDTLVITGWELKSFKVSDVTHKALVLLLSLSKNVRKLSLRYVDSIPYDIYDIVLNSMKNLSSLNFKGTTVEMRFLIPFFDIPSLKMLYVNHCSKYNLQENLVEKRKFMPNSLSTLSWRFMRDGVSDSDSDDPDLNHLW